MTEIKKDFNKQIYIDNDLHTKLKLKSVKENKTLTNLIDEILSTYVEDMGLDKDVE